MTGNLQNVAVSTVVFYEGAFYPAIFRPYYKRVDMLNYPKNGDVTVECVEMTTEQAIEFGKSLKFDCSEFSWYHDLLK